jgi:metal-responsive CopG/Arc/MetJ family transcriptional regulator
MKQEPTPLGNRRRNFYLPDKLMLDVEKIAEKRGCTSAEIVRKALELYVKAWKTKNAA